jgi:hypothetical protein
MIDLSTETPISLTGVTKYLPRVDGKRPCVSTIWRWCRKGVRGTHLEYARLGGRIVTTTRAINDFVNALAAADSTSSVTPVSPPPTARTRSATQRAKDVAQAERELSAAGI